MSDTDPRKGAGDDRRARSLPSSGRRTRSRRKGPYHFELGHPQDRITSYRRRPIFKLIGMASMLVGVATLISTVWTERYDGQKPFPVPGCLRFTGQDIDANVGEIQIIDAAVNYGRCNLSLQSLDRLNHDVVVGGHARLRLVSPLFAGSIEPISQEVQVVKESGDSGRWSWEVRPDKPGNHRLSLVLTIFGPDGKQVQVENNRVEIRLHATADAGYYASLWWTRVTGFIVSLQGLVVAIAAIVAVMGGAAIRKRRNEPSQRQAPE